MRDVFETGKNKCNNKLKKDKLRNAKTCKGNLIVLLAAYHIIICQSVPQSVILLPCNIDTFITNAEKLK